MIIETADAEYVPIFIVRVLARECVDWWIELHLHDGSAVVGELREADENEVQVQDESGDHPFGQYVSWIDVKKIVIP